MKPKFTNLAKFDFKFERKTTRRSIVSGFLLRYARNAKARKGFASLAVATASRSDVKI